MSQPRARRLNRARRQAVARELQAGPSRIIRTYQATLADLLGRIEAAWLDAALTGWDDYLSQTSGGLLPGVKSDAKAKSPKARAKEAGEAADDVAASFDAPGGPLDIIAKRIDKSSGEALAKLAGISSRSIMGADRIEAFRKVNVGLVKSLVGDQKDDLSAILDTADREGLRVEDLRAQLRERFDVSRSKADLIARDQVLKLNGQLTAERQQAAGISRYTWSTSGDERVRESHQALDGTEHAWDDPPEVDPDGRREHPGGDFQCRCVAVPIVPWLDE